MAARKKVGVGDFAACVKAGGKCKVNNLGNGKYTYICSHLGNNYVSGEKTSPLHNVLAKGKKGIKKSGDPDTSEITSRYGTGA